MELPIIFKKPRGRQYILIDVHPDMVDDSFLKIQYLDTKTHKEKKHYTIIRKDLQDWINVYKKEYKKC